MRTLALIAVTGLLSACSYFGGDPEITNATERSVTLQFDGERTADATESANKHCGNFGRSAQLRSVTDVSGDKVAVFDCL